MVAHECIEHHVEKSLDSTNDATQPPVGHILVLSDFTDRKALFFWFLEVTNMLSFVFWLIVATYMAGIHLSFNPMTPWHIGEPEFNLFSRQIIGKILARENSTSLHAAKYSMKQVFVDVWFALSLMVAVDASAVVFTFNRPLIRKFHHVVSQRLMSLASILSFAISSWNKEKTNFGSRYPAGSLALGLAAYLLLGSALDMLERRMPSHSVPCRRGTLAQYSKALGHSETSWTRALFLTTVVGGVGLFFTMLIPPPWSALVPFIHILLESVFLSAMNARRTSRYVILCAPPFFATICVHWGVTPLLNDLKLSITPWVFLGFLLLSRLLLDAHLRTTLRPRSELQWARKNVLISTPKLLIMCILMALLEKIGVQVITYIKPIAVLAFFGLGSTGFLAVAAYDIAAEKVFVN